MLHHAIGEKLGVTIGTALMGVQLILLALNFLLGVRPGIGTVAAAVIPAVFADTLLEVLPVLSALWLRVLMLIAGGTLFAAGTACYLAAELGALPRDGLMLDLAWRIGWSLARIRVSADLLCLTAGTLLLGPATAVRTCALGVGSAVLAFTLGPTSARLLSRMTPPSLSPGRVDDPYAGPIQSRSR